MPAKGVSARSTALVKLGPRIERAKAKVAKVEAALAEARTALEELEAQVAWVGVKAPTKPFYTGQPSDPFEGLDVVAPPVAAAEEPTSTGEAEKSPPTGIGEMLERGEVCESSPCSGGGWSVPPWSRPDISVCGRCGLPSQATLDRVAGERAGLSKGIDGEPEIPGQESLPV